MAVVGLSVFEKTLKWDGKKDHKSCYQSSVLFPVAPEYSTGEVLLAGAYRRLVLGIRDQEVDRADIDRILLGAPDKPELHALIELPNGIRSAVPKKDRGNKQLMPLVPEIARYAGVLGQPRNRWEPGHLLITTVASGLGPNQGRNLLDSLTAALKVGHDDDLLAQWLERELVGISVKERQPEAYAPKTPAWRLDPTGTLTPAERFAQDLRYVIKLKPTMTRRLWTVLLEALMRVGLSTHVLWLCRLNHQFWQLSIRALAGESISEHNVRESCWNGHSAVDPLLVLEDDLRPLIKDRVGKYAQARIGINIVLHALVDAGAPWTGTLGNVEASYKDSVQALHGFLHHVSSHSAAIQTAVSTAKPGRTVVSFAREVADASLPFLRADSGSTKNIYEFLTHTLASLNVGDLRSASYDQSYLAKRDPRNNPNSPIPVRPGPVTVALLVHTCCQSLGGLPVSMDDFRGFLSEYGLYASAGELQSGPTAKLLGELGLTVDSEDAGGGRLLVDPFFTTFEEG